MYLSPLKVANSILDFGSFPMSV